VAAEGTFHFLCSLLLSVCQCYFFAGLAEGIWYWPLPHAGVPEIVAANTKHPQSATRFASLAHFTRTRISDEVAKQRANHFDSQTARVVGAAGDDFWYPSMKSPPYLQPVPSPARSPHERRSN
jgi:hypothetical protein